ncbi:hypothetical protein [Shewanella denitrificans]|uniref:hypothetical protein n=1 Tax=Shewanella denitrificans TaxID=192073 RepID=UPI0002FEAF1C|nr:hypothetical protein [Shewanella denitrificans]
MSNIIDVIERLGASATFGEHAVQQRKLVNDTVGLDEAVKQALLNKDNEALNALMQVRNKIVCAIAIPQDETPDNEDEDDAQLTQMAG